MSRPVKDLLILVTLAGVIVGLNFLFFAQRVDTEEDETNGDRSSYSSRAYGTKAFFTFLNRVGMAATRWEDSFKDLSRREEVAALLIIEPTVPMSGEESSALMNWVQQGGRLIMIGRKLRWPFAGDGIQLSPEARRWNVPRIFLPSPLTMGVRNVQLTKYAASLDLDGAPGVAHIGDTNGTLLLQVPYGGGQVVLLGEPFIVANNGIVSADNLLLARNLLSGLRPGVIAFDEWHHGHAVTESAAPGSTQAIVALWRYMGRTPARFIAIQLGLLIALAVFSMSRRFGRMRPTSPEARDRTYEHVTSLASLWEGMRARTLALENVYRAFKYTLAKTAGVHGDLSSAGNLEAVSRRSGLPADRLKQIVEGCEQALQKDRLTDHQLLHLVTQMRGVEKLVHRRPSIRRETH